MGSQHLQSSSLATKRSKGKLFLSIKKRSFKKIKKKANWHSNCQDAVTSLTSPTIQQAAQLFYPAGISPPTNTHTILPPPFDPDHKKSFNKMHNTHLTIFSTPTTNFTQNIYSSPSPFIPLTTHPSPRDLVDVNMKSNTSSPHSSNSITQPPLLPLSPSAS